MKHILFLILILFSGLGHARLLRIIHTNDLHSYFRGQYDGKGSYSRVMTKIKELKAQAEQDGIEVLQLDAGDWGDGTTFFLSNNGSDSVRAIDMLGVDVATIGNHDHLLGLNQLLSSIRNANVGTKFTVANIQSDVNFGNTITPFVDVERAGIPIRIIGLTTNEFFFQYTVAPGRVTDPVAAAQSEGRKAKAAGKELVIALSHIGVKTDKKVAQRTSDIDVIVGGHSHDRLSKVTWIKNKRGKRVPIVQAWAHGLAVGTLTLDVKDNGAGVAVVDYKLHEVTSSVAKDPAMESFVEQSALRRNVHLRRNADEVIGETDVPITGYFNGDPTYKKSCWSWHMANAAKDAVGAQVGMHIDSFEGRSNPTGPITYGDIADYWPHVRKYGDQGWEIATVNMTGWKLRLFMFFVSRLVPGVVFSGLGYNQPNLEKGVYRVAIPAEAAFAVETSYPQYAHYLAGLKYTGQYYWPVLVDYIQKNSPISCN